MTESLSESKIKAQRLKILDEKYSLDATERQQANVKEAVVFIAENGPSPIHDGHLRFLDGHLGEDFNPEDEQTQSVLYDSLHALREVFGQDYITVYEAWKHEQLTRKPGDFPKTPTNGTRPV